MSSTTIEMTGLARSADPGSVADRERFARCDEALAFYRGEQWPGRRRCGETRLTNNYARTLLRKVASYVFPAPVTFTVRANAALRPQTREPPPYRLSK